MKKIFTITAIILLGIGVNANATVWRVCATPGSDPDFTTIQDAHNSPSTMSGDTLYIESSPASVGTLICTKSLTILGTGYFLTDNPQTQASLVGAIISGIQFDPGSSGSKVSGCTIGNITIYDNDITITRNNITGSTYAVPIWVYSVTTNLSITSNYLGYSTYYGFSLNFPNAATDIMVSNNYFTGPVSTTTNFYGVFTNNVFNGAIIFNSSVKNNIMFSGTFTPTNCVYAYNIGNSTQFGILNNNQQNANMTNVFLGATVASTDGKWQLKSGSPAIAAGEGGTNCGMFGGVNPYILSGMPNIPAIYYFNAPTVPTNTINVAIKAKSHN